MRSLLDCRSLRPFGFEVDIDVDGDLGPEVKAELRSLYERDGLILFRGLKLSMEEQIRLCSLFGATLPLGHVENYLVSNVLPEGLLGTQELLFHNDIPFVPVPYPGGSLHAIDVDEGVSATRFASGYLAYESLPAELRQRIDNLNALQLIQRANGRRTRLTDLVPGDPAAVHSVVRPHGTTGRRYVFVNQAMTANIIGMSDAESDELLEELFSYLYANDVVYEHTWCSGDIVIWDNLAIQHARRAITMPGNRTLQRVTMARFGVYDQNPSRLEEFEQLRTANRGADWDRVGARS